MQGIWLVREERGRGAKCKPKGKGRDEGCWVAGGTQYWQERYFCDSGSEGRCKTDGKKATKTSGQKRTTLRKELTSRNVRFVFGRRRSLPK